MGYVLPSSEWTVYAMTKQEHDDLMLARDDRPATQAPIQKRTTPDEAPNHTGLSHVERFVKAALDNKGDT